MYIPSVRPVHSDDFVTIHGRSRIMKYGEHVDLRHI